MAKYDREQFLPNAGDGKRPYMTGKKLFTTMMQWLCHADWITILTHACRSEARSAVQENETIWGVEWKVVRTGRQTAIILQITPRKYKNIDLV